MKVIILYLCLLVRFSYQQDFGQVQIEPLSRESCCKDVYDKKYFTITNPGFPNGKLTSADCEYKIKRANDNVCRLRLIFKFFSNGVFKNGDCSEGYLEIDGKEICGCHSGLQLITNFNRNWGEEIKVLKYKDNGGSYGIHGFVIEIHQDECSKHVNNKHKRIHKRFYYEPYYFEYPIFNEETRYTDISDFNPNKNTDFDCIQSQEAFLLYSWCSTKCPVKNPDKKCVILDSLKGKFRSPGYPFLYPNNLNQCYRFIKKPGYCKVNIHMLNFQLEYSYNCYKDYFLLNGINKYCGNDLSNTVLSLPFNTSQIDFHFITDRYFSSCGFSGTYEQVVCDTTTTEKTPTTTEIITTTTEMIPTTTEMIPTTTEMILTTTEEIITTTEMELEACGGLITHERYILNVYGYQKNICRFQVRKFNSSVCDLKINFNDFNLNCNDRNLFIDDKKYCGYKSGESISINFDKRDINIYYEGSNHGIRDRILSVEIEQITKCGPDNEVPPPN